MRLLSFMKISRRKWFLCLMMITQIFTIIKHAENIRCSFKTTVQANTNTLLYGIQISYRLKKNKNQF